MKNSEDLFSKICRICLCANNSRTVPLFENIDDLSCYGQAVSSCANIELPHLEYAPNNMCYSCLRQLRQCILFQKKCSKSQKYFEEINFNNSARNFKENIINQLYGDSILVKDDQIDNCVLKERNNYCLVNGKYLKQNSCIDFKESTLINEENHVELLDEPVSSFNENNNKNKPKSNNINDNIFFLNDDRDDCQTGCHTNDIFLRNDVTANDTDSDLFNLIENDIRTNLKKKIKAQYKPDSIYKNNIDNNEIFSQMEEICNNIKVNAKPKIDYSNLPIEDKINSKNTLNINLLASEFDSSNAITRNAANTDFLFQMIEESFNIEPLRQKHNYQKHNKRTIEKSVKNDKKPNKILNNKKLDTHNLNKKASLVKINNILTKTKKKHKVKFRNLNAKQDLKALPKKKKVNKNKDFTCKTCDRKFKSKENWLRHTERHAGITAFICELCGKGFVTKSELGVHLVLTHDTGRHYPCDVCGYKAPKPYDLKEHMRLHTGERPYACDQCGLTFRRLYIMRQHQLCHTEKKFQCPKCPLRFYKVGHVRAHDNNVHARRYMYACALCDRQYARNKTVRQHLTRVHLVPREKQGKIARVFIGGTQLSQPPLQINANSDSNVQNVT